MSQKRGLLTESPVGQIVGNVKTLQMDLSFELVANAAQRTADSPTHLVTCRGIEIGAAWKRSIKKGDHQGQSMFSIFMDDPSFPAPLSLGAFPNGNPNQYDVVWSRPANDGLVSVAVNLPASAPSGPEAPPPHTVADVR